VQQIEIPDPVLTVEIGIDPDIDNYPYGWIATIYCGSIPVLERKYHGSNSSDDARVMILEEFGQALKRLVERLIEGG
jgi:hypothetical protein